MPNFEPSFAGSHNLRKTKVLFLALRYRDLTNGKGEGLSSNEVAELCDMTKQNACESLRRLEKWNYISTHVSHKGSRQMRAYRIAAKGEMWLARWRYKIPWQQWGFDNERLAELDKNLRIVLILRGYD